MVKILIIAFLAITIDLIDKTGADCGGSSCFGRFLSGKPSSTDDIPLDKAYTKVNDYLVDSLPNDTEPEKDLEKAIEWLETEPEKLLSGNAHLVVLENLKELKTLKGDTDCNLNSLRIMKENDKGTGYQANKPRKYLKTLRKIDRVVRHYSQEHAESCRRIYINRFRAKYKEIGNEWPVDMVEGFVDGHIGGKMEYIQNSQKGIRWTLGNLKDIHDPKWRNKVSSLMTAKHFNVGEVYDFIELYAQYDPDIVFLFKKDNDILGKDKVKALVNKYLIEPCHYYMREFGPEIFEPAAYDAAMDDEELSTLGNNYILVNFKFYFGLHCFQICNTVSQRSSDLHTDLKLIAADPE